MAYLRCPQCQLMLYAASRATGPMECPRCDLRLVSVPEGSEETLAPSNRFRPDAEWARLDHVRDEVGQGVTPSTTRQLRSPMRPPDHNDR